MAVTLVIIFIFVLVSLLLGALCKLVLVVLLELLHRDLLAASVEFLLLLLGLLLTRQHTADGLNLVGGNGVWELDLEGDE